MTKQNFEYFLLNKTRLKNIKSSFSLLYVSKVFNMLYHTRNFYWSYYIRIFFSNSPYYINVARLFNLKRDSNFAHFISIYSSSFNP